MLFTATLIKPTSHPFITFPLPITKLKGICYYGSSIPEFLNVNINCSAMLHFGKNDKGIPMKAIKKISSYANEQPNKIIINEYNDADHGFNCEDRKSYNSNAAEMAMHKTLKFIRND